MKVIELHEKEEIEAYLRRDVYLHIYSLGDLDDFFWPYTRWRGWKEDGELRAIVLFYTGMDPPTLLALGEDAESLTSLLASTLGELPEEFYAHLSPGLEVAFAGAYKLDTHGEHYKMALTDPARVAGADCSGVTALDESDLPELLELYRAAYPGNWFDPRMLETGQYFGVRDGDRLVAGGGVHVYSARYKVAALGNIATRHEFRGRGLGKAVTAAACRSLLGSVEHVGLNVKCDNAPAVACYRSLGFTVAATYEELMVERA